MDDIFREIDEDLRRDQLVKLWRRHGRMIIAGVVALIGATVAGVVWNNWRHAQAEELGLRYAQAVATARDDADKGVAALEALSSSDGYGLLARLQAAEIKAKGNDRPGGVAALKAISTDTSVDQPYRDLAGLMALLYGIDDLKPTDALAQLKPYANDASPWRFTARELTALAQLRAGDKAAAVKTYQNLADDLEAPQSLRARAAEVIGTLSH